MYVVFFLVAFVLIGASAAQAKPLDCTTISGCSTCQLGKSPGSPATQKLCTACKNGWTLRNSKTCDCAAGWAFNHNKECVLCTKGQYCPGGDAQSNPANQAFDCPLGTGTIIQGAVSQSQCLTKPGYGRLTFKGPGGSVAVSAVICAAGSYNTGSNTLPCQSCGINLTTAGRGSTSAAQCLAPPGFYKDPSSISAQRCQRGTYSSTLSSASACLPCPAETTTKMEGSTSAAACVPAL